MIDRSPPSCCVQNADDSTATLGPPGRSSSSEYQRPSSGRTPNTSASDAVVRVARIWIGSPWPVRTNDMPVDPPIAENTWFRPRQSWYFGNDAGQVAQDGWVS